MAYVDILESQKEQLMQQKLRIKHLLELEMKQQSVYGSQMEMLDDIGNTKIKQQGRKELAAELLQEFFG